ncbi:MAG: Ig-like domain-containing protein, partial [Spirochaetaceae bacterium]|nr:Ig-like domain-containing protein [Spirochaetaceae bacterium]
MRKPRTGKFIAMLAAVAMASFLLDCQSSIPDWALRMNTASITLFPRFTDRLIADDYAQGLQAQALTWVSSDPSVASVDGSGFVTAIAVGASTVTAVDKAGLSASCEVTVRALPVLGNLDEAVLPEYQEGTDEQGIPMGLVGAYIAPIPAQVDLRPYV